MYRNFDIDKSPESFMKFMEEHMSQAECTAVEKWTKEQSKSPLWYEMRYARITASKLYDASRCNTLQGSLVENILGASHFKGNEATTRGLSLETEVIQIVSRRTNLHIQKCGLLLNEKYPIFGASPDGVANDHIVEVKCPMHERTIRTYIDENQKLAPKVFGQLQMLFAEKKKSLLCVAAPDFEISKKVTIVEVSFNEQRLNILLADASKFWCDAVFPVLFE